jgi:hypothetical protein
MSRARTNGNPTESREEHIRVRAYELFQKRGGQHGRALDDWIQAEAEFLQQSNRAPLQESDHVPTPRATTMSRRRASN